MLNPLKAIAAKHQTTKPMKPVPDDWPLLVPCPKCGLLSIHWKDPYGHWLCSECEPPIDYGAQVKGKLFPKMRQDGGCEWEEIV